MNLFKNPNEYSDKLYQVYQDHQGLVIGVDFDDTIRDYDTGEIIPKVVDTLKEAKRFGMTICLYTCREGADLAYAEDFCKKIGLQIDYVNYSPISPGIRKPLFNILLDDKAGLVEAVGILQDLIVKIIYT